MLAYKRGKYLLIFCFVGVLATTLYGIKHRFHAAPTMVKSDLAASDKLTMIETLQAIRMQNIRRNKVSQPTQVELKKHENAPMVRQMEKWRREFYQQP